MCGRHPESRDTFIIGSAHLRPCADFAKVRIESALKDKLIQRSGTVTIQLTGADFEFVEKADLVAVAHAHLGAKPASVPFELPGGPRRCEQTTLKLDIDIATAGAYKLELAQSDGTPDAIPVTVLPPNPKITNMLLHVNAGKPEAPLHLEGTGLDHIDSLMACPSTASRRRSHPPNRLCK